MIVSIPKCILSIPEDWEVKKLYLYCLSRSCIGISYRPIAEWHLVSLSEYKVNCLLTPKMIKFQLPGTIYRFYDLVQPQMRYNLSGSGDMVLMVLSER
jgi:hypothetical protein